MTMVMMVMTTLSYQVIQLFDIQYFNEVHICADIRIILLV